MLRFGKGNNFFKFRQAFAKACLKEYGHVGRLIEEEKAYSPVFAQYVAPPGSTLDTDEETALKVEAVKEYAKKLVKVDAKSPKMYGFIMQHLPVESKDEIAQEQDYEIWSKALDTEKLWLAIVKTHKVDCVSNVNEVKKLAARKAYQGIHQGAYETLAQYSERFCYTV